jgi:hypothetical protein
MLHVFSAEEERVLELAAATYRSDSTLEVSQAAAQIRAFLLDHYPRSFAQL